MDQAHNEDSFMNLNLDDKIQTTIWHEKFSRNI